MLICFTCRIATYMHECNSCAIDCKNSQRNFEYSLANCKLRNGVLAALRDAQALA